MEGHGLICWNTVLFKLIKLKEYDGGEEAILPQMFETQVKVIWMDECRY